MMIYGPAHGAEYAAFQKKKFFTNYADLYLLMSNKYDLETYPLCVYDS